MKIAFILVSLCTCFAARAEVSAPTPMAQPNAQMQKVLDALASLGGKPIETLSAQEARKQPTPADAVGVVLKDEKRSAPRIDLSNVEDRMIDGAAGPIAARIYWPREQGSRPVIVYYHGGGWVIANKDVYDATPRSIAQKTGAIVVSIDYRQGPENKFPAAHEDAFAAYKWAVHNSAMLGGNNKIALLGESAGGNLAVATAMRARDEKLQMPVAVAAVYPIAGINTNDESYLENQAAKPLNKPMMIWCFEKYLRTKAEMHDQRIDLISANLSGLPPTVVVTAQIDPLRTEGAELVEKLRTQGVTVRYQNYEGVTHEFFGMAAVVDQAVLAQHFVVSDLKKYLY